MKRGLGKGLSALFDDTNLEYESAGVVAKATAETDVEVAIGEIYPNKNQPRKSFDAEALEELKNSILMHGIISPIIVNKEEDGYMIIAGERRYRAAKLAGLDRVPIIVKNFGEKKIAEIALIENLQREDLNVVESARGIAELMQKYSLTQQEIAERLGKSRSSIANTLRILNLPSVVVAFVENGSLSYGHGKALAGVENGELCELLARDAMEKNMSVRELERKIQSITKNNTSAKESDKETKKMQGTKDENLLDFQRKLERRFATKIKIDGDTNSGKIVIDYFTKDDLQRFYEILIEE